MIRWTDAVEIFVMTTLISYFMAPVIRKLALKTGYLDNPKDTKVHSHPTPLLGGLSIYLAFVIGLFVFINFKDNPKLIGVLTASTILLIVGLIDDRMGMIPEMKLLTQFLAAMIVVKSGVRIDFFHDYHVNVVLTYLWIISITNSFNLLDNMNGLSAGIAVIAAMFFGVIMLNSNQAEIAMVSFSLAGSSLGFLKHNFPRANIFMGDSGSLVIGFILASVAVMGSWNTRFLTTSLAMPIIILAYPIFDTMLVTIVRLIERRSIFQGGRDHSSHRLSLLGLKKRGTVLVIYGMCILLGITAILIQRLSLKAAIIVIAIVVLAMFVLGVRLLMVDTGRYGYTKNKQNKKK